jgi:hypothetical protein
MIYLLETYHVAGAGEPLVVACQMLLQRCKRMKHHLEARTDIDVGTTVKRSLEVHNTVKMAVFWVVAQCSLVEVFGRFRRACCIHQGDL